METIKVAAKKSLQGLGASIKSSEKIPKTSLKKDKQIGANITVDNPKFKKVLDKNLDLILKDLANKNFEEYEL